MTPRLRLTLVASCALALGACRAAAPSSPEDIDAALTRDARTIVRDAHFTLTSPFGETATADFSDVVREEGERVRSLLGDPGNGPIRVHLVAIEPQAGESPASDLSDLFPSRHGIAGGASGEDLAFVYVNARDPGPRAFVQAGLLRDPIRHELVHCIARRAGLARAPWFDEGLAREIESMPADASELRKHPFPAALVSARAAARPGTVAELLAWRSVTELSPAERATRYDEAQALLRFLAAGAAGKEFAERIRAVHGLSDAEILERERPWLDWLGTLDALSAIRTASAAADPRMRALCAGLLAVLAERGAPELRTRAADEFALGLLRDSDSVAGATTFLVFFRAAQVLPADLADLRASSAPALFLTGEALRSRRREPVDLERARDVWRGLSPSERAALWVPAHELALTTEGGGSPGPGGPPGPPRLLK